MITNEHADQAVTFLDSLIGTKTQATLTEFQNAGAAISCLKQLIGERPLPARTPPPQPSDAPADLPNRD